MLSILIYTIQMQKALAQSTLSQACYIYTLISDRHDQEHRDAPAADGRAGYLARYQTKFPEHCQIYLPSLHRHCISCTLPNQVSRTLSDIFTFTAPSLYILRATKPSFQNTVRYIYRHCTVTVYIARYQTKFPEHCQIYLPSLHRHCISCTLPNQVSITLSDIFTITAPSL